jgi:hypothetical protein
MPANHKILYNPIHQRVINLLFLQLCTESFTHSLPHKELFSDLTMWDGLPAEVVLTILDKVRARFLHVSSVDL